MNHFNESASTVGRIPEDMLPAGVRSRSVDNGNGLRMHVLEAGFENRDGPCVVLLHGFPELAYSWRKVMAPLAEAGFHVVAPDQRGYGYTTGWDGRYDGDLSQFRLLSLARDVVGLVSALGHRSVAAVVGHDFGSPVAAWCALARPDLFRSVVLMSAPFGGPPTFPFRAERRPAQQRPTRTETSSLDAALAALNPPRKHYQQYFCTRQANADMMRGEQGLHAFLRAYFHHKSGDWKRNTPTPLPSMRAEVLARMPTYYIMDKRKGMAETVAAEMPSAAEIAACRWLTDRELGVYSGAFARTGFQGGLQWYRAAADGRYRRELLLYSGRTLDVPACFIAGSRDWGVYQVPGSLERMREEVCTRMLGCHLLDGAGHWVQQEAPDEVAARLLEFLDEAEAIRAGARSGRV